MPRKSRSKKRIKKRKRKLKRKHKSDILSHARRRHMRTTKHGHKQKMLQETQNISALLTQLLKLGASTTNNPYHYDKRHYSKDKEYQYDSPEMQQHKRGIPTPDVSFLRDSLPPHRGNYPEWEAPNP